MVKWIEKGRLEIIGFDPLALYSGMLYFLMEYFISLCPVQFNFLMKLSTLPHSISFISFEFFT